MLLMQRNGEKMSKNTVKENENQMKENKKTNLCKKMMMAFAAFVLLWGNGTIVFASYGKNAADWFLGQIFWVALAVFVVVVLVMASKKNFVGALTTAVVGAVVVFLIRNPTTLENIGNSIMNTILK